MFLERDFFARSRGLYTPIPIYTDAILQGGGNMILLEGDFFARGRGLYTPIPTYSHTTGRGKYIVLGEGIFYCQE